MTSLSLQEIQQEIFSYSAKENSEDLPGRVSFETNQSEQSIQDLRDLKDKGLICWDYEMKTSSFATCVTNPEHPIYCVAYYGDGVNGYYCLGYAIGCISHDAKTIEISLLEKRSDASVDLRNKFLPVIIDAFTTYALYLNTEAITDVSQVALVGPLEGVHTYYKNNGFKYIPDYYKGTDAMVTTTMFDV